MRIAFIGLGQMGRRMVRRLNPQDTGVWNRSRDIVAVLGGEGYQPITDLEEGVRSADVIVTMVRDHHAIRAVGEAGLFAGLGPQTLWVDMTTGSPAAGESFHGLAASQGARFIAAPVLGTLGPAASGQLTVLAGGAPQDIDAAQPLLERFGTVRNVGTVRQALVLKLMVNTLLAAYMDAVSECLPVADREGIKRAELLSILAESSVAAPVLKGKRIRWESLNYQEPDFPIQLLAKDLNLMMEVAKEQRLDMPGAGALREVFEMASRIDGKGSWDMAGVGDALVPPM